MTRAPTFLFQRSPSRRQFLQRLLIVFCAYFLASNSGLNYFFLSSNVPLIWLPNGIAVVAFFRWGFRVSGAVFACSLLISLINTHFPSGYVAVNGYAYLLIALENTVAPALIAWYLRRKNFSPQFAHRDDVIRFCLATLFIVIALDSLAVVLLWQIGFVVHPPKAWFSWWAGDVAGVLLAAPLLFSYSRQNIALLKQNYQEKAFYLLLFATGHWLIFFSKNSLLQLTFLAMVLMIWAAMRLGKILSTLTVLASSGIATIATNRGLGPFQSLEPSESTIVLCLYMASLAITALMIAALQAERASAGQELRDAFERISKLASRLPGLIMQYRIQRDRSTTVLYVSDAVDSMLEISAKEIKQNASLIVKRIDPLDKKTFLQNFEHATENLSPYQMEFRYHKLDGGIRWLYLDALPELELDGSRLWHCFVSDITDRKIAEQDLRVAAITFESQEGIFVANHDWQVLRINQAYTRITGFSADELVGKTLPRYFSQEQDEAFFATISQALDEHRFWQGEMWTEKKSGELYPQLITLTAIANPVGLITHYIGSFTDISRHKGYEDEILNLAFYDPLTHLPNRRLLMDRLQHLISMNQRDESHSAILFIDLDNFKTLNDTRGHDAGDLLLVETAERLQTCVRESDTVARLGGDEFVVVLQSLSHDTTEAAAQADRIAEKIRLLLNEPYTITDFVHHAGGSIGVCLFKGGEVTVKDLFKRADTAMYEAKTSGRNAVRFFDPAMQA
ncbi:MAG: diguanylate cyclase, partial [Undibacterium sp.]|nr:diguanylate cyclase [Undibacterium sp.]